MKSLIEIVKEKIIKNIPDCNIDIIDNTHLHKHHKSFNKSKTHLKIIIQSEILKKLKRIDSHKKIDKNLTSYVYCAGGYRSVIACSILKRDKFNQLVNVESGFSGISKLI